MRIGCSLAAMLCALACACAGQASAPPEPAADSASPQASAPVAGAAAATSAGCSVMGLAGCSAGAGSAGAQAPAAGSAAMPATGASAGGAAPAAGSGPAATAGSAGESDGPAGSGAMAGASGAPSAAGAPAAGGASGASGTAGAAALEAIEVWLAGDSTVARGNTPCPTGWGDELQPLFSDAVEVVNSAVGGRSVRTWLYDVGTTMDGDGECVLAEDANGEPALQQRWQQMLDGMGEGDYLFIQFGINDSSRTCDRHVGLAAFKDSYGMMAMAAKERGAQPIFVTPVSAIACQGTQAQATRGEFVSATEEAGAQYDVPVIDLHAASVALYTSLGLCPIPGGSDVSASTGGETGAFFCEDHTHFERGGAAQIAGLVAQALRDQGIGLAAYLE